MVRPLISRSRSLGLGPGAEHCVVFWGKTLHSHSAQVYKWVLTNLILGVTLQWTSIPSRRE